MTVGIRKFFCVLLCVLLIVPFAVMTVGAADTGEEYIDSEVVTMLRYPVDEISPLHKSGYVQAKSFRSSGQSEANEPFTFYMQLNDTEKDMYNQLVAVKAGLESPVKGRIDFDLTEHPFVNTNYNKLILKAKSSLLLVLSAVKEDHPEFFYIWGYSDLNIGTSDYTFSNLKYTLKSFSFSIYYYDVAYPGWASVQSYYDMLMQGVADFKVTGNTRYEKVKSIHDGICKRVTYDPNVNDESTRNPMDFDPTSVFCEPYLTVCEGYSEALKMICDREGIPCITVVGDGGGPHKWAYVQMEDGKWYGMDVTWDDQEQDGTPLRMYDFFLSGSETKNAFFGGEDFASLHKPTGQMFANSIPLEYPEISLTSYTGAICTPNTGTTFDAQNLRMFITKNAVLSEQLVGSSIYSDNTPDDHTVTVSGETTGATVAVTTVNGQNKDYTVIRRGDIDANNSVDSFDYNRIYGVIDGTGEEISTGEPEFYAADFNADGVIDAFDLFWMDMYMNDNTEY